MQRLWQFCGHAVWLLSRPLLRLYLKRTRRTRILVSCGEMVLVTKAWMSDGKWSLPGGGIKAQESSAAAILRELQEETSLVLPEEALRLLGSSTFMSHGLSFPYDLYAATIDTLATPKRQGLEIIATAWMSRSSLSESNAAPDVLNALRQTL
jgi:8-oxo-dGTP pyrophosphatase MutT (NUDIX family)